MDLILRLECLNINDEWKQLVVQDEKAHGGELVVFGPPKKRKVIPKVDNDPMTLRAWKLLMENDGSESVKSDKELDEWMKKEGEAFLALIKSAMSKLTLLLG